MVCHLNSIKYLIYPLKSVVPLCTIFVQWLKTISGVIVLINQLLYIHFLHVHWDQIKESICLYLEKTNAEKRSFSSCAPSLWNSLPLSVRSSTSVATFRKCLKIYLFDLAFPPLTPAYPMTCWRCETASSILLLSTDLDVVPLSLATPGILVLRKFDCLIIVWSGDVD